MSGLRVVSGAIMSVLYGLWRPVFCVLGEEGDIICNGRRCIVVYRLPICRWFSCFKFCGDYGGWS